MVTEMEWKCCHGYSGEDCHEGPRVTTDTHTGRPRVTQTGYNNGGGGQRGRDGGWRNRADIDLCLFTKAW